MDIGVFSDPHISEKISLHGQNRRTDSGEKRSIRDARRSFKWMISKFEEADVDLILCGGDVFDRSNPTSSEYRLANNLFYSLCDIAPVVTILGNHSLGYEHGHGSDAMAPLREISIAKSGDLLIEDGPTYHEFEDVFVYCLPYPKNSIVTQIPSEFGRSKSEKNRIKSKELENFLLRMVEHANSTEKQTVLLSHVSFEGSKLNDYQSVPSDDIKISPDLVTDIDYVCAGHIHKFQQVGGHPRGYYVTPLDRWSFSDEGDPRGAFTIDTESKEMNFHENPHSRDFKTIDADSVDGFDFESSDSVIYRVSGEVEEIENYNSIDNNLTDSEANVVNQVEVKSSEEQVEQVNPQKGIKDVFESYTENRDVIPESKENSVYACIKDLIAEVS